MIVFARRNYATLTDGEKTTVLRYDADHLRKYSKLLELPGWTLERVQEELRADMGAEIAIEFDEPSVYIEQAVHQMMPFAIANIHPPREEADQ